MAQTHSAANQLYFGDCLDILRDDIKEESVDLIYLDPPFNSSATYNVLFKSPKGLASHAQIEAFEDTWHWGEQAEVEFAQLVRQANTNLSELMQALRQILGENDMMAYLTMMASRLLELHRVLKPTGSLYLHCDPTASHYLKTVLDGVFGAEHFTNEIAWRRSLNRSSISKSFRRAHDTLFFYTKSDEHQFNIQYRNLSDASLKLYSKQDAKGLYRLVPLLVSGKRGGITGKPWRGIDPNAHGKEGMHWVTVHENLAEYERTGLLEWPQKKGGLPQLKYYLDDNPGVPLSDFWDDIDLIHASSSESLGYPTQKPLALLERIIQASSNEGDVVLDPFCGCGTAIHAAQALKRQWVGIDITHLAITLVEVRLRHAFPGVKYEVHGTPKDLDSARDLATRDKYQFQWWACSLVAAQPYQGKKKGADSGIDGLIFFQDDNGPPKKIVVSVKGGESVSVAMVRDLAHVAKREKAEIGLFITLAEPTEPMKKEATKEGFYDSPAGASFPRLQVLTIRDLLESKDQARYPDIARGGHTFKQAKVDQGRDKQGKLL